MNAPTTARRAGAALWLCTLVLVVSAPSARADVKLSPMFGDHMVLQQGMPVPVWGTADANEEVTVTLGGQSAKATADGSGKWVAKLAPLTASSQPAQLTAKGKNEVGVK